MQKIYALLLLLCYCCTLASVNCVAVAADNETQTTTTTTTAASPYNATTQASAAVVDLTTTKMKINKEKQSLAATHILTPHELAAFLKSLNLIKHEKCRQDFNATLNGILAGQQWAIAMYDATAKSAFGIENTVLHHFGQFDECLDQTAYKIVSNDKVVPVLAQYCLATVSMEGLTLQTVDTRQPKRMNSTDVHWGACVPASCNGNDIAAFLQQLLQRPVSIDAHLCQLAAAQSTHVTAGMFLYAAMLCFCTLLAVLSTAYHCHLLWHAKHDDAASKKRKMQNETLNTALLAFSIIENTKKLFQASKDQLSCINGIKSLAMLLILAGHAVAFIFGGPAYNAGFINEHMKEPAFAFLTNSVLFVDTFLLLSGFLFCRILLIALARRHGNINFFVLYVGRYIRLTPAYLAIIGFYVTWFPSVGSGPLWQQRIQLESERCKASWWLNVLYINNYFNTDKFCMFQSWYLSVDTQLFVLAPFVIFVMYKSRKLGLNLVAALVVLTAAIPFIVTYVRELDPTMLVYYDEVVDLTLNAFYSGSYIKTHMRASAYVVGLLTGLLVHIMHEKCTKLPTHIVRLAWLMSIFIGIVSMFSVVYFYVAPYTNLESTLYAGLHKLGWNLSNAWLVLAATTGHAGWLQRLLSKRIFAPISRLTYCAYLSNGIVELYHYGNVRSPLHMTYINLFNFVTSHILNTFMLAFCICLLFESPIHALERILLRKAITGGKDAEKSHSQSPSTSEEQVA